MNTSTDENVPLQGWTSSPNGRGTIDILFSSSITLILCSWTVLCLNVFPSHWSHWRRGWQKFLMACMTIIGPEFTFQLAIGQWCSARRSIRKFRDAGYKDWTMTHAFYADMGGFLLKPSCSDKQGWPAFPLNADQIHYLVTHNVIPYDEVRLDEEDIMDKNKADGLVRIITVLQITYYLVTAIVRKFQDLAIAILELATCAFIICTLGTYYFWRHKPVDVLRARTIHPKATIEEIVKEAGDMAAKKPYKFTPLDFASPPEWSWTLYWAYWMRALYKMTGITFVTKKRPIDKLPDDYYPALTYPCMIILFFVQTGYASVHISGWDFHFPTQIEKTLWHVTTLGIIGAMLTYWVVHIYAWEIPGLLQRRRARKAALPTKNSDDAQRPPPSCLKCFVERVFGRLRNNSLPHDPAMDVPLKAILPILVCVVVYCFCRAYVLVESFVNLRALPQSAYASVNWLAFIPHF